MERYAAAAAAATPAFTGREVGPFDRKADVDRRRGRARPEFRTWGRVLPRKAPGASSEGTESLLLPESSLLMNTAPPPPPKPGDRSAYRGAWYVPTRLWGVEETRALRRKFQEGTESPEARRLRHSLQQARVEARDSYAIQLIKEAGLGLATVARGAAEDELAARLSRRTPSPLFKRRMSKAKSKSIKELMGKV